MHIKCLSSNCDILYVGSKTEMNQNNYQTAWDTRNEDLVERVDWEKMDTIFVFAGKGGLEHAFSEMESSLEWGGYLWKRTKGYVVSTKGVPFPFMNSCYFGYVSSFPLMIFKCASLTN